MTNTACAISRETLPMLISVHDAMRMGITRNRFYALSHRDNNIVVTIGDRVFLHRAFPHEFLYQYISVLDDDKKEIGIIFDISDLTEESEALVKTEIDLKYYSPVIKDIKSVKERYGFSYWKVILDDGRSKDITMQDTFKNILHTGEDSLVLVDVDGNRFTVKSVSALSSRSYRKIELYL